MKKRGSIQRKKGGSKGAQKNSGGKGEKQKEKN